MFTNCQNFSKLFTNCKKMCIIYLLMYRKQNVPVNERLFEICKACHFVEECWHGIPRVTVSYGEKRMFL